MHHLNPTRTGLTVGLFLGGWHLVWSLLVALSLAQPLMNFVLSAHMIHLQFTAGPFEIGAATVLVIITFLFGCAIGYVFAAIWNWLHKET